MLTGQHSSQGGYGYPSSAYDSSGATGGVGALNPAAMGYGASAGGYGPTAAAGSHGGKHVGYGSAEDASGAYAAGPPLHVYDD